MTNISKSLFASTLLASLALTAGIAEAQHDVRVFLSESGVGFLEDQVPAYVPSVLEPPTFGKSFACIDLEQRDTTINLSIDKVNIDMPDDGRIRVALEFSGTANGELYADDIYACFGEVTCQDTMNVDRAKALLDFDVEIVGGQPRVRAREVSLDVRPDDFAFDLNDCGFTGSALTTAIGFAEGWILDYIEGKVSSFAEENLAPMLESMLSGLSMEAAYVNAEVQDLYFPNDGVSITADVGLRTNEGGVACVRDYDKGAPPREGGESPPDLLAGTSDVNMAVNLGLLNQGLYTAWQQGLLCIDNDVLFALGLDVDFNIVGTLLPGFPPGTEFALEVVFTDHPKVTGMSANGAGLVVDIGGILIDLHGDRPDGTRNTLHVEVDLQAQAELLVNPADNAINARLRGAEIKRMLMSDEREATGDGYDVARIKQLVHDHIVPKVVGELAPIPVTGSVFAVSDYAVLLRSLDANKAYLSAGIDLFRIPENDSSAPDTQIVGAPSGISNPHDALIKLGGSDDEIPAELLQYLVTVDGVERPLSFVKDLHVGEMGQTKAYEVSVVAVDLSGNVDPTPATVSVLVDGVVPFVVVQGSRNRSADEGAVKVEWTMRDDRTWDEELGVRVEVYELQDPSDALSTRLVETQELPAGTTETMIDLVGDGGVYRVEVHVTDEAGNDSQSSLLLSLASTGGCSVGGDGTSSSALFLLLALGLLSLRRRRN